MQAARLVLPVFLWSVPTNPLNILVLEERRPVWMWCSWVSCQEVDDVCRVSPEEDETHFLLFGKQWLKLSLLLEPGILLAWLNYALHCLTWWFTCATSDISLFLRRDPFPDCFQHVSGFSSGRCACAALLLQAVLICRTILNASVFKWVFSIKLLHFSVHFPTSSDPEKFWISPTHSQVLSSSHQSNNCPILLVRSGFIVIQERTAGIYIVPVKYSSARDKALHDPGCDLGSSIWKEVLVLEQALMCLLWDHHTVQIRVLF